MQLRNLVGLALVVGAASTHAVIITPTYSTFADLTIAQQLVFNFTGSGLNNIGPVAISTFPSVNPAPVSGVTMALSATPRTALGGAYVGPPVTNNGVGTYFAQPGLSPGAVPNNNAGWNFNYAVVGDTRGLTFQFFADTNAGLGTDVPDIGAGPFLFAVGTGSAQNTQNSANLGFPGWDTPSPFDPNALGEYTFSLRAFDGATMVGEVAIQVNVVPEPEAYGLALAGMAVVGFFGLRRKAVLKR